MEPLLAPVGKIQNQALPGGETISIIVPVTERHDDMGEMYREYKTALATTGFPFEMIFVVDGNFPTAYKALKALKEEGEDLRIVKHSRGFGEAAAITSGCRQAKGKILMTLPAYRQIEASELPRILENFPGWDMVVVRRWPRYDSLLNQYQTKIFDLLVRRMTGDVCHDVGCGVRLFRREILDEVNLYGDLHRFLPFLSHRQGFKVREIDISQSHREKRTRTYSPGVYLRRMIDLLNVFFLTKFSRKPLRFFGLTGTTVLLIGMAITAYLVFARLFLRVELSDRPLFLMGILLVVLGIQIIAIGLIGEIIIFTHAKNIKEYMIEEIIN
jgi:glycosyltransferase involved in cell wall biosynthesis